MPREIKVELLKKAYLAVRDYFQQARAGDVFVDGALIEFLRVLFADPELPIWERFWLERKRDLDRKRYGQFKSRNADLELCLNVWNRNHFNLFRNAQWPWAEQTCYVDCVKPITYQNQLGQVHVKELGDPHKSILRDFTPQELTPLIYKMLGLLEAPWDYLIVAAMDPDTSIHVQCADTVRCVGVMDPVHLGIGVDAPLVLMERATCTLDVFYRSVLATCLAGGQG